MTGIDTLVYFWLALTIVCVVVEALTLGLTSIWFAFGGLAALVAGILGAAFWLQIVCFIVVTIVMLVITRPLAVKFLKPGLKKTNVDAIPGKMGEVIEEILPIEGKGQVKLEGQIWSAKTEDGKTSIPVGTVVTVIRVEGVKVVVR